MEVYFEKNIINEGINKHKKRNMVFRVLQILSIVLFVVMLYFNLTFKGFTLEGGVAYLVFLIFLSLVEIALPLVGILIFTRLLNNLNAEYDYFIVGSVFRVVKVLNRTKRKKFLEIPLDSISAVGLVDSENYLRYKSDKKIKKVNAYCNEVDLAYFYISRDGDRKLILLELDANFALNLKKALHPAIIDKSVNDYYKRATEVKQ